MCLNIIRKRLLDEEVASQFYDMLAESLSLMDTTLYPKTFFGRYKDALFNAKKFLEYSHRWRHRVAVRDVIHDLTEHRTAKIEGFVYRCYLKDKLYFIKDELLSGQYDIPSDVVDYVEQLLSLYDDDYVPESGEYIYCSVSFNSEGKTYYYKTDNEELKCGDKVIVPVGKEERPEIATIEKIEKFSAGNTPFPPRLTKDILGKTPF